MIFPENPRILIVDDMQTNLAVAELAIRPLGYVVFSYKDPLEALAQSTKIRPHAILLDVEMSPMSGIELAIQLKKNSEISAVPIIFLTTLDDEDVMKKCFEAGGVDFIHKPYKPLELQLRLNNILLNFFLDKILEESHREFKTKSEDVESLVRLLVHDLASPLMVIQYQAEELKDQKILSNVMKIQEMIKHVREMMALESGKKGLELTSVEILPALDSALESLAPMIENKKIKINIDKKSIESVKVLAEPSVLRNQIFVNLISNAVKFSFEGENIDIYGEPSAHNMFTLYFKDYGVGIPPKMVPHLFDKFKKTSREGTNKEKGTGFGMPLVKSYLDRFMATIQVSSIYRDSEELDSDSGGTIFKISFSTGIIHQLKLNRN